MYSNKVYWKSQSWVCLLGSELVNLSTTVIIIINKLRFLFLFQQLVLHVNILTIGVTF